MERAKQQEAAKRQIDERLKQSGEDKRCADDEEEEEEERARERAREREGERGRERERARARKRERAQHARRIEIERWKTTGKGTDGEEARREG